MRAIRLATMVALTICVRWAPAQDSSRHAPAGADSDTQDIVFFEDSRPVLVRLHIQVDGESFQAKCREQRDDYILRLFKCLDRDGDGALDSQETGRFPRPQMMFPGLRPDPFEGGINFASKFREIDTDGNGKLSLEELAAFYARDSAAAFQVRFGPVQTQFPQPGVFGPEQAASGMALSETLFKQLDSDKDGRLSQEEFANAPSLLLKLDTDDDEKVTAQELMADQNAAAAPAQIGGRSPSAVPPSQGSPFLALTNAESARQLTQQLLARYDKSGNQPNTASGSRSLDRSQVGLDQATFDLLDADRNGKLDTDELLNFHRRRADIELIVRLGRTAMREAPLDVFSADGQPAPLSMSVVKMPDGSARITLGKSQISVYSAPTNREPTAMLRQLYLGQFKGADMDMNGYLDKEEAQRAGLLPLFQQIDADGDGKIFEQEFADYFGAYTALQIQVASSRIVLSVLDSSRGLFDILDKNRDGVLGLRELRAASRFPAEWDRNGDGYLTPDELPRSYELSIGSGTAMLERAFGNGFFGNPFSAPPLPRPGPPVAAPLWFQKMDRNRDGDISPREFLGTRADFDRIDTNGDGLIDAVEAARVTRPQ